MLLIMVSCRSKSAKISVSEYDKLVSDHQSQFGCMSPEDKMTFDNIETKLASMKTRYQCCQYSDL